MLQSCILEGIHWYNLKYIYKIVYGHCGIVLRQTRDSGFYHQVDRQIIREHLEGAMALVFDGRLTSWKNKFRNQSMLRY